MMGALLLHAPTMLSTIDKFRGVEVAVSDVCGEPQEYLVKFISQRPGAVRRLGDEPTVAPRPALVVVRADDGLEAVGFMPPEDGLHHIRQVDYERKALEAVRDHLAAAIRSTSP
jgi:hypothetical protein